jgi:hypothetical protein
LRTTVSGDRSATLSGWASGPQSCLSGAGPCRQSPFGLRRSVGKPLIQCCLFSDALSFEAYCLVRHHPLPVWPFLAGSAALASLGAFLASNAAASSTNRHETGKRFDCCRTKQNAEMITNQTIERVGTGMMNFEQSSRPCAADPSTIISCGSSYMMQSTNRMSNQMTCWT